MRIKWVVLTALIGLNLGACSLTPPKSMMDVQANEKFQLNQTLTVPANATRVFIQFGKVTTRFGFSRADQHCELEVKQIKSQAQKILPDHFVIDKVRINSEMVAESNLQANHILFAEANNGIRSDMPSALETTISGDFDNDKTATMDSVMLYLKPTAKNPNILRLTCSGSLSDGSLQDAPRSYRPEKAQINQILGAIGHLQQ